MAIRIKRSSGNLAPSSLAAGQLAYVEGSENGGTLYIGEISNTVREIAGKKYVDKLNGIEAGAQVNTVTSVAGRTGAVTIATTDLSDFNTAVDGRITSGAVTGALGYTPENAANKGQANGYAGLDANGFVPAAQLPSFVEDVLEFADLATFPATGESGKIYVAVDTGKIYRWSGSIYVEISASPGSTDSVTEGSTNLYFTQARARGSISVSGDLSYDSATGVISYTKQDLSGYVLSTSLATVATSGDYDDLSNKPTLFDGDYDSLSNKPDLSGFITAVEDDTAPKLGGDLDVTGFAISSESDVEITVADNPDRGIKIVERNISTPEDPVLVTFIEPAGDGTKLAMFANSLGIIGDDDIFIEAQNVSINDITYPSADGTAGQVLTTDGNGNLSFTTVSTGATTFAALTDTPANYTNSGGYFLRVNSGATGVEFVQDIDDGTF